MMDMMDDSLIDSQETDDPTMTKIGMENAEIERSKVDTGGFDMAARDAMSFDFSL